MSRQDSIAAARNSLPALVHAVEAGPPVELTRRGKPDLWEAMKDFRRTADLESLDIDEVYAGARDRSPGREPEL